MNSIPSPQTVLTMYNKLTMVMLPAGVKNSQDYDSRDLLSCFYTELKIRSLRGGGGGELNLTILDYIWAN